MKMWCKSISSLALVLAVSTASAESLWKKATNDERGLYTRQTASRVGDILTVLVSENASLSASGPNMQNAGSTSGLKSEIFRLIDEKDLHPLHIGTNSSGEPIEVDLSSIFRGDYASGDASYEQTMSVSQVPISVTVIDTLPNGNLVVEGAKIVSVNKERLYAVLRGVVRPQDVTGTNTVTSGQVANAYVEFVSEGSLSDAQKKGWFTRMIERANPF
ncbi:MAG: flagellar basal body L-ring protein FlgH [Verrucomicrobiota bacterium JB022]|nr:flagellar basal body L-ring protein FlgH [Verrucomicrobiota bacterium JB022]